MKRISLLLSILLLLSQGCEKQFTYCDFRYTQYILKKGNDWIWISPIDENFNLKTNYKSEVQVLINQGYVLDSNKYNKYFCESCSEEQKKNAMKYGAYCVSN